MPKILIKVSGVFRVSQMFQVVRMTREPGVFTKTRVFRVSGLVKTVSTYKYKPLPDEKSIRLLTLDPGKDDDPLTGTLEVIQLHNPIPTSGWMHEAHSSATEVSRWIPDNPYEAISYVWGSSKKFHTILLSGKLHPITANLSDALHQCRYQDQPRVLWADSICIDQDKLEEKNPQVYMMGRIYASSQCTLICLGTDPDNRGHARDAYGLISDANQMIQETFNSPGFSWELNCFPRPPPDDPLVKDSRWQSVVILVDNPWFSRGWVVQEAALGREASMLWAGCEIAVLDFLRVYTWHHRRLLDESHSMIHSINLLFAQIYMHESNAEGRTFFESDDRIEDPDIMESLHRARWLRLSDPRDRIYAFMALPFVRKQMPALHPNYNQPHLELYQELAKKYLKETSDLNLLSYVLHKETKGQSPDGTTGSSWVPRWDRTAWRPLDGAVGQNFGKMSAEPVEIVILDGENNQSASLQVRAVIFDSIKLLFPQVHRTMTIENLITLWSHWSKKVGPATASRKHKPSSEHDSMELLTALSSGLWDGTPTTEGEWADMLKSYSRVLQNSTTSSGSPGSPQIPLKIQTCHRRLMVYAQYGRVFLLGRGYYGLGPDWDIKEDDVCAFVFGVRDPLILRKVSEAGAHHYKVISPAFVVSKKVDKFDKLRGLNQWNAWDNWDDLCELEGWADWGLREEKIILL